MALFVIKNWRMSSQPMDQDGTLVDVTGRRAGILSWMLSLIGIDPTVRFRVTSQSIHFERGSLEGFVHHVIPLRKVSSSVFGMVRPWKEAIALFFVLQWSFTPLLALVFGASSSDANASGGAAAVGMLLGGFAAFILSVGLSVLYYALKKRIQIGVIEDSGVGSLIEFKRSVIEGQVIDERQAPQLMSYVQHLVDLANSGNPMPQGSPYKATPQPFG